MILSLRLHGEALYLEVPSGSTAGDVRQRVALPNRGADHVSLYNECGLLLADGTPVVEGERYIALIHLAPLLRFVVEGTGEVREVYRPEGVVSGDMAYEAFWQSFDEEDEDRDAFLLFYRGQYLYEDDVVSDGEIEVLWRLEEDPSERE